MFALTSICNLDNGKLMTITSTSVFGNYNHVLSYATSYVYNAGNWTRGLVQYSTKFQIFIIVYIIDNIYYHLLNNATYQPHIKLYFLPLPTFTLLFYFMRGLGV